MSYLRANIDDPLRVFDILSGVSIWWDIAGTRNELGMRRVTSKKGG